jgi:hypothetical protein
MLTADHKEGEQLEDRRKDGDSSCNFGDGTDQRVQSLMFMMMMMMMMMKIKELYVFGGVQFGSPLTPTYNIKKDK